MDKGTIIEEGTYQVRLFYLFPFHLISYLPTQSLTDRRTVFSSLIEEYGSKGEKAQDFRKGAPENNVTDSNKATGDDLMQAEERNTGAVSWGTYKKYLEFAGGVIWVPIIITLLFLNQASQSKCLIYGEIKKQNSRFI